MTAVNRGARVLDVDTLRCPFYKDLMPLDVYKSRSLVSLKLVNVGLLNPGFVVSLPCLKIMHLEDIQYSSDDGALIVEKLVSGCPVLEDLTLCRSFDDKLPVVLRVSSQTLKRFCVKSGSGMENDAPGLKCIEFRAWFEKACGETKRRGGRLALTAMAPQSERFVYPATKRYNKAAFLKLSQNSKNEEKREKASASRTSPGNGVPMRGGARFKALSAMATESLAFSNQGSEMMWGRRI